MKTHPNSALEAERLMCQIVHKQHGKVVWWRKRDDFETDMPRSLIIVYVPHAETTCTQCSSTVPAGCLIEGHIYQLYNGRFSWGVHRCSRTQCRAYWTYTGEFCPETAECQAWHLTGDIVL